MSGALERACETPVVFDCAGEQLLGIVHRPCAPNGCGVLVVVGGPQYRIGAHRQFVLLARRLCAEGFAVMRFDYRGMGDSGGELRGFEHCAPDVAAAIDAFHRLAPDLQRVVLLGLCDAASAALLHRGLHSRLAGLVLLNPWVTEGETDAGVMMRHYYLERLGSKAFWRALATGRVRPVAALRGVARTLLARARSGARHAAAGATEGGGGGTLSERMARGLAAFPGPVLVVTSGRDLTAAEFLERSGESTLWRRELAGDRVRHVHLADANHTFARAVWRAEVEALTLQWLAQLAPDAAGAAPAADGSLGGGRV